MSNGNPLLTWKDQEGLDGFGSATSKDLSALLKALTAGSDINPPGSVAAGDGFALRTESLDQTLRNVTYRMKHIRLWKLLAKAQAYNTVEEWNQIQEYGQALGNFISEGALPRADDASYERKFAQVKFLGVTRAVTHVMSLVRAAHAPAIAQETISGTMALLRSVEDALFYGDSSLDSRQWDGFVKQIEDETPADNIRDLRGAVLTEADLEEGGVTMGDAPNYGTPTHLLLNPRAKSQALRSFYSQARYPLLDKPTTGTIGLDVARFTTSMGDVNFVADTFINLGLRVQPSASLGTAPAAPSFSVQPAAAAVSNPLFIAGDAGDYRYAIVGVGSDGKTAAVQDSGAVTVAAGDEVTMTLASGSDVLFYEIYRTKVNAAAGTGQLIARVARSGATQVFTDSNATLPGTTIAIMFQMDSEAVTFRQLSPMTRVPLATIDSSVRWMQLLYGVPVLHTPGKIYMFKNVAVD